MDDETRRQADVPSEVVESVSQPIKDVSQLVERNKDRFRLTEGLRNRGAEVSKVEVYYAPYDSAQSPMGAGVGEMRRAKAIFITSGVPWELSVPSDKFDIAVSDLDDISAAICQATGNAIDGWVKLTTVDAKKGRWSILPVGDLDTIVTDFGGYRPNSTIKENRYGLKDNSRQLYGIELKRIPLGSGQVKESILNEINQKLRNKS